MKSTKLTLILFLVAITATLSAQRKKVNVSSFEGINLGIHATMYVTKGSVQSVELEGDDKDLERITVEVNGDVLKIKSKNKNWKSWNNDVKVHITTNSLNFLSLSGSGNVIGKGQFSSDELKVMVSGSGDLKISADAKDLNVKISGSGNIALNGNSNNTNVRISGPGDVLLAGIGNDVNVNISGSGELNAEEFKAKIYDITITGSGKCKINVEEEIKSNITGSGSVYYKGDPKRLNNHTSGSGKIKKVM